MAHLVQVESFVDFAKAALANEIQQLIAILRVKSSPLRGSKVLSRLDSVLEDWVVVEAGVSFRVAKPHLLLVELSILTLPYSFHICSSLLVCQLSSQQGSSGSPALLGLLPPASARNGRLSMLAKPDVLGAMIAHLAGLSHLHVVLTVVIHVIHLNGLLLLHRKSMRSAPL